MSISRKEKGGRRKEKVKSGSKYHDPKTARPQDRKTLRQSQKMITIRKATPKDAEVIIDFQQKMAWETEMMTLATDIVTKGVKAVFSNTALGQYWVAEDDGQVVASLLITYEWSDWRNANVWWFQSVYVLPSHRRSGIFRSMYMHIRNEGERTGVAGLRLYVETNNTRAHKTYEALGMKREHYAMYEWMKE